MMSVLMNLQTVIQQITYIPGKCTYREKKQESSDSFKLRFHLLIHTAETWILMLSLHSSANDNDNSSCSKRKCRLWSLSTWLSGAHFKVSTSATHTEAPAVPERIWPTEIIVSISPVPTQPSDKRQSPSKCFVKAEVLSFCLHTALQVSNKVWKVGQSLLRLEFFSNFNLKKNA